MTIMSSGQHATFELSVVDLGMAVDQTRMNYVGIAIDRSFDLYLKKDYWVCG